MIFENRPLSIELTVNLVNFFLTTDWADWTDFH
jgi:hypothetical protein